MSENEYVREYRCEYCKENFKESDLVSKSEESTIPTVCKKCAEEKKSQCLSIARFGDDYGDNSCTFHCQLPKGHEGDHEEKGNMYNEWSYVLHWKKEEK